MLLRKFTGQKLKIFEKITNFVAHCYKSSSRSPYPSLWKSTPPLLLTPPFIRHFFPTPPLWRFLGRLYPPLRKGGSHYVYGKKTFDVAQINKGQYWWLLKPIGLYIVTDWNIYHPLVFVLQTCISGTLLGIAHSCRVRFLRSCISMLPLAALY